MTTIHRCRVFFCCCFYNYMNSRFDKSLTIDNGLVLNLDWRYKTLRTPNKACPCSRCLAWLLIIWSCRRQCVFIVSGKRLVPLSPVAYVDSSDIEVFRKCYHTQLRIWKWEKHVTILRVCVWRKKLIEENVPRDFVALRF